MCRRRVHKTIYTSEGDSKITFAHLLGEGRGGWDPATVLHGQWYCFSCEDGSGETKQKGWWKCCQQSHDHTWPRGTGSSQLTQRQGLSII